MSLREQMILKDGKARPPALIQKICVHNGTADLEWRARGDMCFDIDFINGRQEEVYSCLQCGHPVSARTMMKIYQQYILKGLPVIVGRKYVQV